MRFRPWSLPKNSMMRTRNFFIKTGKCVFVQHFRPKRFPVRTWSNWKVGFCLRHLQSWFSRWRHMRWVRVCFDQLVVIMPAHNCCYLPKSLLFIPEGGGKNHALSQLLRHSTCHSSIPTCSSDAGYRFSNTTCSNEPPIALNDDLVFRPGRWQPSGMKSRDCVC